MLKATLYIKRDQFNGLRHDVGVDLDGEIKVDEVPVAYI